LCASTVASPSGDTSNQFRKHCVTPNISVGALTIKTIVATSSVARASFSPARQSNGRQTRLTATTNKRAEAPLMRMPEPTISGIGVSELVAKMPMIKTENASITMTKKTAIRNAVSKMDPGSRFTALCGDCICICLNFLRMTPSTISAESAESQENSSN